MTDPYGSYGQPTTSTNGTLGKVAFAISVATFGLGVVAQIAFMLIARDGNFGAANAFYLTRTVLSSIAHLLALVLAVVAVRDVASRPLLPGIAIGISGSALLGTLVFTIANWLIWSTF